MVLGEDVVNQGLGIMVMFKGRDLDGGLREADVTSTE
jgi:hypothetical protein